ncbi:MAG: homocysteine S-methyltransferase family protein [Planctomycetota bacterium]
MVTILDGPLGTELNRRGVSTDLPLWSAGAIESDPETVEAIHREYADAGATIHTANTFRTKRRTLGDPWERFACGAVRLAKNSVPADHRIAGSIAPLEDCYRPDLSPGKASFDEHQELAEVLAEAGADILLCETFPHAEEAIAAVDAATGTGLETWLALTAGPDANLMSPMQMAEMAKRSVDHGAMAVLVNCTPAVDTLPYVIALAGANLSVPIGAYANAGHADDEIGWSASPEPGASAYADLAAQWIAAGATLIGSCCGTTPKHVRALANRFGNRST